MLEKDDILELLEFVLTTTYFAFRGEIYRQKFGTAMGSPVSPLVANMFMEQLERKLSATVPEDLRPKLWKRYVDDSREIIGLYAHHGGVFMLRSHQTKLN